MTDGAFDVAWAPMAQRDLRRLPEKVVTAVAEFVYGPRAANPRRVGRPLTLALTVLDAARRGAYRVIYRIDDQNRVVRIVNVDHRAHAYRRR